MDAVHGHARTLALLAPALHSRGVEATRKSLDKLMTEMEQKFPGSREHSVFASVELSLQRLSAANRDRARVLGVFHGAADLDALRHMMQWEQADVDSLAVELVETGLATPNRYNHLTLNPALCPYLRAQLDAAEREALTLAKATQERTVDQSHHQSGYGPEHEIDMDRIEWEFDPAVIEFPWERRTPVRHCNRRIQRAAESSACGRTQDNGNGRAAMVL